MKILLLHMVNQIDNVGIEVGACAQMHTASRTSELKMLIQ